MAGLEPSGWSFPSGLFGMQSAAAEGIRAGSQTWNLNDEPDCQ
jgi:hypothetical protein